MCRANCFMKRTASAPSRSFCRRVTKMHCLQDFALKENLGRPHMALFCRSRTQRDTSVIESEADPVCPLLRLPLVTRADSMRVRNTGVADTEIAPLNIVSVLRCGRKSRSRLTDQRIFCASI